MKRILLILLVLLLSTAVFAEAKKGLFLGLGVGMGSLEETYSGDGYINGTYIGSDEDSEKQDHIQLDGKLGLGFGKLVVFANAKLFIETEDDSAGNTEDETFAIQFTGIGASYFLTNSGIGSLYITGSLGKTEFKCLSDSDIDDNIDLEGVGIYLGAGLEIGKGLAIELGYFRTAFELDDYTFYNAYYSNNITVTNAESVFSGVILSANLLFY